MNMNLYAIVGSIMITSAAALGLFFSFLQHRAERELKRLRDAKRVIREPIRMQVQVDSAVLIGRSVAGTTTRHSAAAPSIAAGRVESSGSTAPASTQGIFVPPGVLPPVPLPA